MSFVSNSLGINVVIKFHVADVNTEQLQATILIIHANINVAVKMIKIL